MINPEPQKSNQSPTILIGLIRNSDLQTIPSKQKTSNDLPPDEYLL